MWFLNAILLRNYKCVIVLYCLLKRLWILSYYFSLLGCLIFSHLILSCRIIFSRLKAPQDGSQFRSWSRMENPFPVAITTTRPIIRSPGPACWTSGSRQGQDITCPTITTTITSRPSTPLTLAFSTRPSTTLTTKWPLPWGDPFRPSCTWATGATGTYKIPPNRACAPTCNIALRGDRARSQFLSSNFILVKSGNGWSGRLWRHKNEIYSPYIPPLSACTLGLSKNGCSAMTIGLCIDYTPLWEGSLVSSLKRLDLTKKENMWLIVCSEAVEFKLKTSRTVILPAMESVLWSIFMETHLLNKAMLLLDVSTTFESLPMYKCSRCLWLYDGWPVMLAFISSILCKTRF